MSPSYDPLVLIHLAPSRGSQSHRTLELPSKDITEEPAQRKQYERMEYHPLGYSVFIKSETSI